MTMISTVFGGLPLVFASGAGAEARIAVGWVVVGGLGFATVFTLFLTPVFYRLIAPLGSVPGSSSRKLAMEGLRSEGRHEDIERHKQQGNGRTPTVSVPNALCC